jgi:hypothetical protein
MRRWKWAATRRATATSLRLANCSDVSPITTSAGLALGSDQDFPRSCSAPPSPTILALVPKLRRFALRVIASTVLGLDPVDRVARQPLCPARQARHRLLRRLGAVLKTAQAAMASGAPIAGGGLDLLAGGRDEAGLPQATTTWRSSFCCCLPATKPPHPP